MHKAILAAVVSLAIVSGAHAAPAKPLSTFGFDKNLIALAASHSPALYYSPNAGTMQYTGTAAIAPSAGIDGNAKTRTFFLDTTVVISGLLPIAPAVASIGASTQLHTSGEAAFTLAWDGLAGGVPLADGYYQYAVDAVLSRTGPGASAMVLDEDTAAGGEFIYDATPPSLALSVADGAFFNTLRPSLGATYGDGLAGIDAATVRLTLDGQDVTAQFTITAAGATWNPTADLTEGAHVFTVTAADRAGNAATASVSFILDVTPPALSLVPEAGAQLLVQRPDLIGAYSDALSGIDTGSVAVQLDGAGATARFTVTASQAAWNKEADLAFGDHAFSVSVADRAGNVSAATVSFAIVAPYRYFTLDGDEIRFTVEGSYFLVNLGAGVSPAAVLADLIAAGASAIATQPDPFGYHEVGVAAGNSAASVQAAAKLIPGIEKVYPVVAWPDGRATGTAEGVYVKFVDGTADAAARAALAQAGAVAIDGDCCEAFAYHVRGSLNDAAADFLLADTLRGVSGVAYAAPSLVIRYQESIGEILPDGTAATQGWLTQAGVQASWPTVYGGGNYFVSWTATPIGVLSTGVQASHPSLSGRVLPGYSAFGGSADPNAAAHAENSLGTAMAGILAANWGSNGLYGITKDSPILPAKVREYSCGQISGACFWTTSDQAIKAGAKAALDAGARVLLFDSRYAEYLPQSIAYLNAALQSAADGRGALGVFPMGDEKHEIYSYRAPTPLNVVNTAFVTAVDESNVILDRANVHATDSTRVNFAAPGKPILTLDATGLDGAAAGNTAVWQGTPMAAAIFAGSAALSYIIDRGLTVDELLSAAQQTGTESAEEIERSPLFKFFLWILSILHMQEKVEIDLCNSSDAAPDLGVIHQAALGGPLANRPLPVSVQLLQGQYTSTVVGFSAYKYTGGAGVGEDLCARFDWTGNVNPLLIWADKRVIRFSNTTADEIKLRVDSSDGGGSLSDQDMTALGFDPNDLDDIATAANYRVLRDNTNNLTAFYDAKPYSVLGISQPYSRTATLHMWSRQGALLDGASTQLRACVRRCFVFFCSTVCSPAVSLLDTDDSVLGQELRDLKHAILANESLAYEYRALEADFDMNAADFEDRILTLEAATKLEAFRQELSAAVGADLLLSAVGLFDNPMERIGTRYGELLR